ncbi:lipocalin family protein [Croceiramulus getboli]|nr:lipocalin family protein [Flavobacteriaceae bacterium YJPT1-3]
MKKLMLILCVAALAVSCGPRKVVKESRKTLKGYWSLDEITYGSAPGTYNVTLFDDVSAECLTGSTWRFIPNNNFGNYEITDPDCPGGKRYFVWSIPDVGEDALNYDILLKPTDEKMRSTMNNKGFRLSLSYLSEESLTFQQTLQVNGSPFVITMNFSKISE